MKNSYLFFLFFCLLACSSAQKSLDNKNYSKAYRSSLNDLGKKNPDKESKGILIATLTEIIMEERNKLEILKNLNEVDKKKQALKSIGKLQNKINRAEKYIGDTFIQTTFDLEEEERLFTFQLSDIYVQKGRKYLDTYHETNRKDKAKKAYQCFEKSKKYLPFTVELDSLSKNSLKLAQVIYTIDVSTLWNTFYAFKIDNVFSGLFYHTLFRQVYSDDSQTSEEVDCNISISLSSLDLATQKNETTEDFEKEIITTETITNDDGEEVEVETSNTVTGKVITIETIKTAEWDVSISVYGTNNCPVSNQSFSEKITSIIEEERQEGDERALPSKKSNNFSDRLMSDSDMADELLEKIYSRVEGYLF